MSEPRTVMPLERAEAIARCARSALAQLIQAYELSVEAGVDASSPGSRPGQMFNAARVALLELDLWAQNNATANGRIGRSYIMADDRELREATDQTGLRDVAEFAGHVFYARRDPTELRWQIFRDSEVTPYGYVTAERCPHLGGEWRLRVYDTGNHLLGSPSRHAEDHDEGGCVGSYLNALVWLKTAADGHDIPRAGGAG